MRATWMDAASGAQAGGWPDAGGPPAEDWPGWDASLAGRRDAAHVLLGLLRPYHDRLSADPAAPLGAVAHYLGLLANTVRDWQSAEAYLRQAADIHRTIGAHRWRARTLLAWARMLHDRGDAGDHAQATRLLGEVAGWARRHGYDGLHDDAEQLAGARPAASSISTVH